jgi:hypothetical protein
MGTAKTLLGAAYPMGIGQRSASGTSRWTFATK